MVKIIGLFLAVLILSGCKQGQFAMESDVSVIESPNIIETDFVDAAQDLGTDVAITTYYPGVEFFNFQIDGENGIRTRVPAIPSPSTTPRIVFDKTISGVEVYMKSYVPMRIIGHLDGEIIIEIDTYGPDENLEGGKYYSFNNTQINSISFDVGEAYRAADFNKLYLFLKLLSAKG